MKFERKYSCGFAPWARALVSVDAASHRVLLGRVRLAGLETPPTKRGLLRVAEAQASRLSLPNSGSFTNVCRLAGRGDVSSPVKSRSINPLAVL